MDKHSVGGLPGNRTTMLVVPIIAAYAKTAGVDVEIKAFGK